MAISLKIIGAHWRAAALSAPLWAFAPSWVAAAPAGGHIVGGSGSITHPNSNLTEIHQGSDRLAIDWQQFNVNANEVVKFIQPSSHSIALNRILDSKQSLILGRIEANGRIFLINPRGIIFGKDATVNVAGLVASSLDIDPRNFINGKFEFTDNGGEGVIVNQGTIEAAVGGAVVLLGKVVINEGEIRTPQGSAQLVSAGGAVISFDDNEQLGIQITAQQQQKIENQTDAVRNSGTISAPGGYIALTGTTTADLFTNAVNNEGVLVANSARNRNGVIELTGGDGNVAQSGRVDVSAADGNNGGKILISGNAIHDTGKLTADGANGGDIQLHAQDLILTENNAAITASGSAGNGGHIELLADRVGVMNSSRIDASGTQGGGVIHVGGTFYGAGSRNANRTVVDNGVSIYTDATVNGNGGEVVLWSDQITYFGGKISARGGVNGGDGGNIEVSGKQSLNFTGFVDTSAPHGKMGNLLLDPAIINIINGSGGADDTQVTADNIINSGDGGGATYTISEAALEGLSGSVTLSATQQINIANLTDNLLLFNAGGGTITFNINGSGNTGFAMADVNDEIRVNNGNLVINSTNTGGAVSFTLGKLTTTAAGNITVSASATCTASFFSACDGGAITVSSGAISSAGAVSFNATSTGQSSFFSFGGNSGGDVALSLGNIASSGAVTIGATSAGSTGGFSFTPGSGNTTITLGNIIESGNANIQVTADSTYNTALETINVGGSYLTDGTGGNISFSGNTLNLTSNTLIENAVFAAGATITISDSTPTLNGHTLAQGYNNIYVGDISGSATTFGDFGFSQANIDAFTSAPLVLRAKNNIFIGNTTVTSTGATAQLVANRDNTGGGDISLAGGNTLDANGRNLTLSGANAGINGNIVNSGSGTQQITTTAAINMGSAATLTSGSGNISLNAGTGIAMANNSAINSTTGQLALTATNNIALGILTTGNATTSAVNVTSSAGAISNAGAATNISANAAGARVGLHAASGINAALSIADLALSNSTSGTVLLTNDRALQISSFTNTPATAASVTTTGVGSDITIAGSVSSGSNLAFISSGAFTVNNGNTVNANAGTLSINSTGDAAITGLTSTNNTASAISVISGGAIADNGNTNLDISATQANAVVTLQAANGIGAANALDLAIANLALSNSMSGAVNLTNNRALQINSFTNTPTTATSITTTGVGSNMIIAGNVASGSNIALTSSGTFSVTDGFTINPAAGTLNINSTGNAAITGLTTTNNTANAISVISGGAISDNGNTNLDITATQSNAVVTLQSANGIGAANAIDLAIANLALSNSTSGAVNLTNNRALQINSFTNTPATAASVTTTGIGSNMTIASNVSSGSNLALTSSGTFTVNDGNTVNSNAGTLVINATGDAAITGLQSSNNTVNAVSVISGGAISDNGDTNRDITATAANAVVTLQAANGIGAANPLDLTIANLSLSNSTSGVVNLTNNRTLQINSFTNTPVTTASIATTGVGGNIIVAGNVFSGSNLALTSSGTFSVTDGFTVNPTAGTLSINAAGNAAITGLTTTNNTASAISVVSGGAISDAGDINADITAIQPNAVATLQAASGIGNGNAIDINGQIVAANGNNGDIRLHALGSYTFGAIDNSASANGAVALSSDGNLTVNNVTTANGTISLNAVDDVLLATGAVLQSTAGNVSITADTNSSGIGQIMMGNGTINSGSGTIALNAAQDIHLNTLTTTNATTNAVSIASTAGKILGNFDGVADITAISAGSRVTLQAVNGIDAGSNPLELSILDLVATNTTSGGINLTNNRALQISGLTNTPATLTTITATGAGSDLIFVGALQNGGGNATLMATRNIDLQNVANVAALSTNSAAVSYAQSIAARSINSTGAATVAGNLTATTGNIDLQTVALGAGAHAFSSIGGNDINLGAITGNSNLQLSSGRNITLTSVALGAGNFSATSATNGIFTASGTVNAFAVTLNQFSVANLPGIVAGNTLDVTANTINLNGDLLSAGAMTLTGTTQLQSDILLSEAGSGGLLQLAGSVIGNAHVLTITAATNTVCIACTTGASASGLAALDIQRSIKSVLGATSVNGNATINADQEIYLNGDTTITGNLALLADANNDGIGIAALLTGKQLNVSGTLTTRPIALSSITTPAQCATPTGLPQMPSAPPPPSSPSPLGQPAFLTPSDVQIAIQESDKYGLAASEAMLRNVSQIAYLGNNCQTDSDTRKNRGQCDVDASMLDFLGTFLIDNQIPKNGSGQ